LRFDLLRADGWKQREKQQQSACVTAKDFLVHFGHGYRVAALQIHESGSAILYERRGLDESLPRNPKFCLYGTAPVSSRLLKNSIQEERRILECGGLTPLLSGAQFFVISPISFAGESKAASSRRTPKWFFGL
jgi:hypothetical protein